MIKKTYFELVLISMIILMFINGCGSKISIDTALTTEKGIADMTKIEKKENYYQEPIIIANRSDYKYQWNDFIGIKYVDTTGSATLILDKNSDLYYFGKDCHTPELVMHNVKKFSLADESDTMGYTAPFAVILTKSGDLYACGDTVMNTIRDVSVLNQVPENTFISFLEPLLINTNVVDCNASFREIDYLTKNNELFRSKYNYWLFDMDIDNPTAIREDEDVSGYFVEKQNYNYILSHTVQMACGRGFFVSVLEDGSVWSCFLPSSEDYAQYAIGYGEIMGDGTDELIETTPTRIFPPGTCF